MYYDRVQITKDFVFPLQLPAEFDDNGKFANTKMSGNHGNAAGFAEHECRKDEFRLSVMKNIRYEKIDDSQMLIEDAVCMLRFVRHHAAAACRIVRSGARGELQT